MTTKRRSIDKERRKVVWQGKRDTAADKAPAAVCPACHAAGSLVDRSPTTAYFVCPHCEYTWHDDRQ